jgi:hypothetical protein
MELSTSSYSRKTIIQTATTSVKPTRHPALVNSQSESDPLVSSRVSLPMPSPPRQRVAPSVSRPLLDRIKTPSAPLLVVPAAAPRSDSPPRQPQLRDLASHQLWAAVAARLADHQYLAEEVLLASLRPWAVAVRLASPQVSEQM